MAAGFYIILDVPIISAFFIIGATTIMIAFMGIGLLNKTIRKVLPRPVAYAFY